MKKQDKLEDKIILYECFKKYLESYKITIAKISIYHKIL